MTRGSVIGYQKVELSSSLQPKEIKMNDQPTLQGPSVAPASGQPAKQLVIFCHGVGSDGQDLIGLVPYFAKVLPDAQFVSPNGPEAFDLAPAGYQWFSLNNPDLLAHKPRARFWMLILISKWHYTAWKQKTWLWLGFPKAP